MICSSSFLLSAGWRSRSIAVMTDSMSASWEGSQINCPGSLAERKERGQPTVPENLEPFGLAGQGPRHVPNALPSLFQPPETCLYFLCQLRRLVEAGVEHVDLGAGLLVGSVPAAPVEPDRHPPRGGREREKIGRTDGTDGRCGNFDGRGEGVAIRRQRGRYPRRRRRIAALGDGEARHGGPQLALNRERWGTMEHRQGAAQGPQTAALCLR